MEKRSNFSASKWEENPLRRVETRDGRIVRILCVDGPDENKPVCGFVETMNDPKTWTENGHWLYSGGSAIDLEFVDYEKTEFTDFELACGEALFAVFDPDTIPEERAKYLKKTSKTLLEAAYRELQKSGEYPFKEIYDRGFKSGKNCTESL